MPSRHVESYRQATTCSFPSSRVPIDAPARLLRARICRVFARRALLRRAPWITRRTHFTKTRLQERVGVLDQFVYFGRTNLKKRKRKTAPGKHEVIRRHSTLFPAPRKTLVGDVPSSGAGKGDWGGTRGLYELEVVYVPSRANRVAPPAHDTPHTTVCCVTTACSAREYLCYAPPAPPALCDLSLR